MDNKKKKETITGIAILLALLIIGISALTKNDDDQKVLEESTESLHLISAKLCSEKRVRAELPVTEFKLHKLDAWQDLTETGDGGWTVTGPVTARNSVGGQTETSFTCTVHFTNEEATACNTKCVYLDPLAQ